jgi:glycosyltransferase involved in cell wall biosynthesis
LSAPTFTVFTPTYNRAGTLPRVHASLTKQSFRDFEWLIVDDGSDDDTEELVAAWGADSEFPIRYVRQENRGKHVAFNHGVREARGELFLSLDSDDELLPHALERFKHHWDSIPERERAGFSAVTGLCVDGSGELVGTRFPNDPTDSDPLEIRFRYRVQGEKCGFHRTEVLRATPFPEPPGQRYVTESIVWARIAREYRTRYVNEPVRIYHTDDDAASITAQVADVRGLAAMFAMVEREQLNCDLRWARYAPREFLVAAAQFTRHSLHEGVGPLQQARELNGPARVLWALAWPVGLAIWARDQLRGR